AAIPAAGEIEVLLDHLRQAGRVLNGFAVHVQHHQVAVGHVVELHGPEPDVGRPNELRIRIGAIGHQLDTVRRQRLAVNQVAAHIGDEGVAVVFGGPGITAVDGDAGGAGEVAGGRAAAFHRTGHDTL